MLRNYSFCALLFLLPGIAFSQAPELVADLNTTGSGLDEFKTAFVTIGSRTILIANNGATGYEPYVLENNALSLLKDIAPGTTSSQPEALVALNDKVYFVATDSLHGRELWVTDGTAAGTALAYDLQPGTGNGNPVNLFVSDAGQLFFERNHKIYAMTPGSAPVLLNAPPYVNLTPDDVTLGQKIVKFKNGVAFSAQTDMFQDSVYMWISDGTPAGTHKVASFAGDYFGGIYGVMALKDYVLFAIENSSAPANAVNGFYAVSGTPGEAPVKILSAAGINSQLPARFLPADDHIAYFYTSGGMYATDGTPTGTIKLTGSLQSFLTQSEPYPFAFLNGKAFFIGDANSFSPPLYQSDGTVAGTSVLKTISENFVESFIRYRNKIFFVSGIFNGFTPKIWESDLTAAGTKSIYTYSTTSSSGPSIIPFGFVDNYLYFQSNLGGLGRELYRIKVDVAASLSGPQAITSVYSLQYAAQTHQGQIIDSRENERLNLRLFDMQGRALQHLSIMAGETFQTTPFAGCGVLVVQGEQGTQAFQIIGY